MAVYFGGQLLTSPTTASVINDDAMQNQNPAVGNAVVLMGKALGGEPNKVLAFGSPEDARAVLRGGDLMNAVIKAFDASAEIGAPSTVYGIRVGQATQSELTLKDGAGTNVIKLKSVNYGVRDNQLKAKVENGTVSGKRVTIQQGSQIFTADNLGRSVLSIAYGGGGEAASVTVTSTELKLTVDTVDTTITLANYDTVDALAGAINLIADWEATVLGGYGSHSTVGVLDTLASTSALTNPVVVTANLQAVIDWVNQSGQQLVTATRLTQGTALANISFTAFTGGSDTDPVLEDWQDAFTALQSHRNVLMITPLTGDADIHAMADAHCDFCSNVLRLERRAICGTASGTSQSNAKAAAAAINSPRTSLCFQGHYEYNTAGELELRPPYMTAAIVSAMFAAANPGTPMTNKTIKVRGLEFDLRNPVDTDDLINAGLLCVENTDDGYKVVQSISTWTGNTKYNLREQSCGIALDYTVRAVRQALDVLRGQKASPLLASRAASITESTLAQCARPEPEGVGAIVGDANSPAYRNIRATVEGDVTRVTFECSPAIPNNYNLVTVYASPYSGSVNVV